MMNSKFLIIDNNKYRELQQEIIIFLWDNGNEVMVNSDYKEEEFSNNFTFESTCIVSIGETELNNIMESENWSIMDTVSQSQTLFDSTNLHFSPSGVYSNALPYPHRLFAFKSLELSELLVFFEWCLKMRLFTK